MLFSGSNEAQPKGEGGKGGRQGARRVPHARAARRKRPKGRMRQMVQKEEVNP